MKPITENLIEESAIQDLQLEERIYFPEELKHFFINFQNKEGIEKVVIGVTQTQHLTFHFGMKSKVFDIHLTNETKPTDERHKTIFAISHADGEILMNHCLNTMKYGFEKYWLSQRINIGKFKHHTCCFIQQDNYSKAMNDVIKKSKKKIQIRKSFSKSEFMKLIVMPEKFEFDNKVRQLGVYRFRRGISSYQGFIWYPPNTIGRNPYFVSIKNFEMFNRLILSEFLKKSIELNVFIEEEFKMKLIQNGGTKYLINYVAEN